MAAGALEGTALFGFRHRLQPIGLGLPCPVTGRRVLVRRGRHQSASAPRAPSDSMSPGGALPVPGDTPGFRLLRPRWSAVRVQPQQFRLSALGQGFACWRVPTRNSLWPEEEPALRHRSETAHSSDGSAIAGRRRRGGRSRDGGLVLRRARVQDRSTTLVLRLSRNACSDHTVDDPKHIHPKSGIGGVDLGAVVGPSKAGRGWS